MIVGAVRGGARTDQGFVFDVLGHIGFAGRCEDAGRQERERLVQQCLPGARHPGAGRQV